MTSLGFKSFVNFALIQHLEDLASTVGQDTGNTA